MAIDIKSPIKILPFIFILVFIAGYSIFEARGIILGPSIVVKTPENGSGFTDSLIVINGQAKNVSYLNLNDSPLPISEQGEFTEKFLLSPGYNIIELDGKDRFGRQKTVYLELFYKLEA